MNTRIPLLLAALPASLLAADKVTFDDQVFGVFEQACLNCHNPDKAKGGLDLSSFSAALKGGSGGKIAEPGDAGSKLLAVITHSAEPVMPPEGDKIPADKIALVKAWIDGGLLENKGSKARKASKPKFNAAMRSDPAAKPDGPPPMPQKLPLDPVVAPATGTAVWDVAASPWAPLVAITGQKQVLLYDTDKLRLAGVLPFPDGDPTTLAFTPDGRYLLAGGGTGGKSGTTLTWDITTGEVMLRAGREFDSVLAADLRPDFTTVATGGPSRLLKIWDTESGEATQSIKKHTDWITALDISPDGVLLASGDRNGGVWVWEAGSAAEFHTLRAHQARITTLAFRPDSNILASASEDGSVRFWEMNNGNEVKKLDAHKGGVIDFAWARDGSFATIGKDNKVKAWKADFGVKKEIKFDQQLATSIAISSDASKIFVGDWTGAVNVFRSEDGSLLGALPSNPPALATRLATLGEQIRTQPQQIATAEAAHKEAERKLAEARKQVTDAEAAAKAAQDAHQQAKNAVKQLQQCIKSLDAGITQLDGKAKAQHTQLAEARAKLTPIENTPGPELDQARSALAQLEQQLAATEAELAKARAERESAPAKLATATKAVGETQQRIEPARKAIDPKRKAVAPAEQAVAAAAKTVAAARARLEQLKADQSFWQAAAPTP